VALGAAAGTLPAPQAATDQPAAAAEHLHVFAPSVGTFYRQPEPGAAPFVSEGDVVTPGQQIGIVEAMKLMLPVEADRPGRIVKIYRANGDAVEYGEPLFALAAPDAW
jgi:acetyl-CoA carboxylase biotin carboxyl carrier protein